ncbi:hypothetical protein HK096_006313, partial [Nowakowskiella sp. JEL0078]
MSTVNSSTNVGTISTSTALATIPKCWIGLDLAYRLSTITVTLVFIFLVISSTVTIFEPDPKKYIPLSRPHSRIELIYLACRTIIIVMTDVMMVYFPGSAETQWAAAILCCVSGFITTFAYTWYLPYYHFKYNCLRAALMSNFLWASLCFLFTLWRPYSDIGLTPLSKVSNPYIVELKVRFKLEESEMLFVEIPSVPINLSNPLPVVMAKASQVQQTKYQSAILMTKYPIKLHDQNIFNFNHKQQDTEGLNDFDEQKRKILEEILELYQNGLKKFPESCFLHLALAQFYLCQLGNKTQCLALHARAKTMKPQLDEDFLIYRRQQLLDERFSGGD